MKIFIVLGLKTDDIVILKKLKNESRYVAESCERQIKISFSALAFEYFVRHSEKGTDKKRKKAIVSDGKIVPTSILKN